MSHTLISRSGSDRLLRSRKKLTGEAVQVAIVVGDLLAIVAASVLSGVAYHQAVYDNVGEVLTFLRIGAVIATVVVIFNLFRGEYQLSNFLSFTPACTPHVPALERDLRRPAHRRICWQGHGDLLARLAGAVLPDRQW